MTLDTGYTFFSIFRHLVLILLTTIITTTLFKGQTKQLCLKNDLRFAKPPTPRILCLFLFLALTGTLTRRGPCYAGHFKPLPKYLPYPNLK